MKLEVSGIQLLQVVLTLLIHTLDVDGDLDVDGHTNLDNVSIAYNHNQ